MTLAFPKPEKRSRVKARLRKREKEVKQTVRATVDDRDGYCRLYLLDDEARAVCWELFGPCGGTSEWAHIEEKRRARTVGMAPEDRHTTAGSVKFCASHHDAYDDGKFHIDKQAEYGANKPMTFVTADGEAFHEATLSTGDGT